MDTNEKQISFKVLKNLVKESFSNYGLDVTCIIFKSIDDLNLIIYSTEDKSIVCYDINNNQKVNEVLNAHKNKISYLNQYSEKKNRINVMLSISGNDNNLKVWNITNFQCLYNFKNINSQGWINCSCFLNDNNKIYVLSTNSFGFSKNPEPIKVYDLEGRKIMNINNSNINTNFIDIYYDNKTSKKYIITGNAGFSKSYDYNHNKVYHIYNDKDIKFHTNSIIKEEGDKVELIESSQDGNIRIWNFHTGDILKKINISLDNFNNLYSICLWNNDYLLVCCGGKNNIKIINLNKKQDITEVKSEYKELTAISKIVHSQYGECLVSQGKSGFILWKPED